LYTESSLKTYFKCSDFLEIKSRSLYSNSNMIERKKRIRYVIGTSRQRPEHIEHLLLLSRGIIIRQNSNLRQTLEPLVFEARGLT
jgi:hypothetical protein